MMQKSEIWLRVSYWTGAIIDAKTALLMLFPQLLPDFSMGIMGEATVGFGPNQNLLQQLSALLIFSWTCLLLWADRKPIERKGVLFLVTFPVLTGIVIIRIFKACNHPSIILSFNLWTALCIGLFLLFAFSYINSPNSRQTH